MTIRWTIASLALLGLTATTMPIQVAIPHLAIASIASTHASLDFGIATLRKQLLGTRTTALMPTAVPAAPLVPCGAAAWTPVANQNGSWDNGLGGIAAVSPTDMWAVGSSLSNTPTTYGSGQMNTTEHWDGRSWSMVPAPQPGADDNVLNDVAAFATNDVWAVGSANTGGVLSPTALHWNGSAWSAPTLPAAPFTDKNVLNDVMAFASNDVWAVGQMLDNNGTGFKVLHPYIVHWDGANWTRKDALGITSAGQGDNVLYGVGGTSTSDLYAVGYSRATPSALKQELILHWNGTAWTAWTGSTGSTNRTLTSVAALSTTDAMAVGYVSGTSNAVLAERSINGGASWQDASATQSNAVNILGDVAAVPPSSYDVVGYTRTTAASTILPLFATWTANTWTISQAYGMGSRDTALFSLAVPDPNDVWAVGMFLLPSNLSQNLIEVYNNLGPPSIVSVAPGDGSATVSWNPPCGGASPVSSYVLFAYDGCSVQAWQTAATSPATFTGLTNGSALTFRVGAVTAFGMGQLSAASSPVTPVGATAPAWVTACSSKQYAMTGSDGSFWQDMDATNLSVSFTPAADSWAIVSGNADLWTQDAGYNQDIGVYVSGDVYPTAPGQPEAWKESGGFAGTFSPNAAFVQTVIPVKAGKPYSAKLQWKTNGPDPGTVRAGAGPLTVTTDCVCPPSPQTAGYSPTRLTVQLIPTASAVVFKAAYRGQAVLAGSNGTTWVDMDPALSVPFTPPPGNWTAFISGNADLWTQNAGYNQDIGVTLSGPGYPTAAGQPEAWKESGGFAGTFSPNAAFVQTAVPVTGGNNYTAKLQWKTNGPAAGAKIRAGAGPIGTTGFSPTSLTVVLVPSSASSASVMIQSQPALTNSDGTYWQPVDPALTIPLTPIASTSYLVSANADLWTTVAGYNQDIGIMVSGGVYGGGYLVAWKESGGLAGTFSPNAAFVSAAIHLQATTSYKIWAVWKTNSISVAPNTIRIGAGPINSLYSPTRLSIMQLSTP